MAFRQAIALFGVLAFLGTFMVIAASIVAVAGAKLIGEKRLARYFSVGSGWLFGGRGLAAKIIVAALVIVFGYSVTLFGASIASEELTLPVGAEKYFCEVDCHLAYSVTGMQTAASIGAGASATTAQGSLVIIYIRTRFDETTISRHRGNGPLTPSPREITLVDDAGRIYPVSQTGQQALSDAGQSGPSLLQPLRPGESYISKLAFDVSPGAHNLKLLIESPTEPRWISGLIIGDEGSVLHKKVFLALPGAQ